MFEKSALTSPSKISQIYTHSRKAPSPRMLNFTNFAAKVQKERAAIPVSKTPDQPLLEQDERPEDSKHDPQVPLKLRKKPPLLKPAQYPVQLSGSLRPIRNKSKSTLHKVTPHHHHSPEDMGSLFPYLSNGPQKVPSQKSGVSKLESMLKFSHLNVKKPPTEKARGSGRSGGGGPIYTVAAELRASHQNAESFGDKMRETKRTDESLRASADKPRVGSQNSSETAAKIDQLLKERSTIKESGMHIVKKSSYGRFGDKFKGNQIMFSYFRSQPRKDNSVMNKLSEAAAKDKFFQSRGYPQENSILARLQGDNVNTSDFTKKATTDMKVKLRKDSRYTQNSLDMQHESITFDNHDQANPAGRKKLSKNRSGSQSSFRRAVVRKNQVHSEAPNGPGKFSVKSSVKKDRSFSPMNKHSTFYTGAPGRDKTRVLRSNEVSFTKDLYSKMNPLKQAKKLLGPQGSTFKKRTDALRHNTFYTGSAVSRVYGTNTNNSQLTTQRHISSPSLDVQDFEILSTAGQGYFGKVKVALLKKAQKMEGLIPKDREHYLFALKVLNKAEQIKRKQITHTFNQRDILKELKGASFFPSLYTTFQDDKHLYLCMEFIEGGQLFTRLRRDIRFKNEAALFYISELIVALQELHDKKIVYRDLKPENILIDKEGHIKLVDFGFAKRINDKQTLTLCGTPGYIAPEILQQSGHDYRVDIWSLGVLIYELSTGMTPFYDQSVKVMADNIINCNIRWQGNFDAITKDLIKKLLVLDPNLRYSLEDIKGHKYFASVDWDEVQRKIIKPPYIPPKFTLAQIKEHEEQMGYYQKQGVAPVLPMETFNEKYLERKNKNVFDNF